MTEQQKEAFEKGYLSDDGRLTPKGALVNIEQMLQPGYQASLRSNAVAVTSLGILEELVHQSQQMANKIATLNMEIRELESKMPAVPDEDPETPDEN